MLLDWTGREIRADKRGAETRTRLESDEKGDGLAMEWVPAAHVIRWVATQALLGLLLESQASKIAPRTARSEDIDVDRSRSHEPLELDDRQPAHRVDPAARLRRRNCEADTLRGPIEVGQLIARERGREINVEGGTWKRVKSHRDSAHNGVWDTHALEQPDEIACDFVKALHLAIHSNRVSSLQQPGARAYSDCGSHSRAELIRTFDR
jgi:hypothetical protein